ncbi:hypothetical protein BJF88_00645 [Cellulosimicrobium sp. CUA-896]|nr:hypothetical protein BJF88_00645 [Cellulosimicrobium sp. CUA-896]
MTTFSPRTPPIARMREWAGPVAWRSAALTRRPRPTRCRPPRSARDEVAGLVEVCRRLHGDGLDAGQRAARETGQHAAGRELEQRGDAHLGESLLAQVPAHRGGDLRDEAAHDVARGAVRAAGDVDAAVGLAVGVRQEGQPRVGDRPARRDGLERLERGLHERRVERAGDLERHDPRLRRRVLGEHREVLVRTRGDDLATAVDVRGPQPGGLDRGEDLVRGAAHDGAHAARARRGGLRHGARPVGHETDAPASSSTPATAAAASSPTECPAVTSTTSAASRSPRTARSATSEDATMSGWATAVSRIVSASDVVPCASRSVPAASPAAARASARPAARARG